ncbi:hypothetical protein M758_UG166300 [Ceratodon purpureus]|nr:hypothetical protein M758_UG166300 [Ceratodon purpureus]
MDFIPTSLQPSVRVVNRVDESVQLKSSFQSELKQSYRAEAAPADFQHKAEEARGKVNKWAEDETHGKIANILPPDSVSSDTRMILANAIYFKGAWKKPFYESSTEEHDFFLPNGKTIQVPMMQTMTDQYVKSYPTFKALRLPYKFSDSTRSFSMFVLLPHDKNGLRAMEESLNTTGQLCSFPLGRWETLRFPLCMNSDKRDLIRHI